MLLSVREEVVRSRRAHTNPPSPLMKRDLWLRLRAYHFENLAPPQFLDRLAATFGSTDASTRAFANKLARKLGWTPAFARRAIEEYRKFVYLGVVSETVVTPPKVIDQVWHEHLLFSRAYREFCRDVLQRDFDHSPELIPSAEQVELYEAQYHATLTLYHTEFNVAPPAAFWGTPKFATKPDRRPAAKRRPQPAETGDAGGDDLPLFLHFDGHGNTPGHHDMAEFGGGGGFSGAGGGDDWGDSSGSGDSSGGGDSGGGSSCSSSCGGGGCGGD